MTNFQRFKLISNNLKLNTSSTSFAENVKLVITSDSDATIQVRVYDIIAKLLEDKMVKATDIQACELGNR